MRVKEVAYDICTPSQFINSNNYEGWTGGHCLPSPFSHIPPYSVNFLPKLFPPPCLPVPTPSSPSSCFSCPPLNYIKLIFSWTSLKHIENVLLYITLLTLCKSKTQHYDLINHYFTTQIKPRIKNMCVYRYSLTMYICI